MSNLIGEARSIVAELGGDSPSRLGGVDVEGLLGEIAVDPRVFDYLLCTLTPAQLNTYTWTNRRLYIGASRESYAAPVPTCVLGRHSRLDEETEQVFRDLGSRILTMPGPKVYTGRSPLLKYGRNPVANALYWSTVRELWMTGKLAFDFPRTRHEI